MSVFEAQAKKESSPLLTEPTQVVSKCSCSSDAGKHWESVFEQDGCPSLYPLLKICELKSIVRFSSEARKISHSAHQEDP